MTHSASDSHGELMIGVSGIRGTVGTALTPIVALEFVLAYAAWLKEGGQQHPKVVLASDTRTSREMMRHAVLAGLVGSGCEVIDLGIVTTPTLQLAVPFHKANGAICITASHNPVEWNALKFFQPNGMYIDKEMGTEVLRLHSARHYSYSTWDAMGGVTEDHEATERHIEKVLELVDVEKIRAKKFKVVLDGCNGAGNQISPEVIKRLGCELIHINDNLSGRFPHNPEPLNENLVQLSEAVKEHGADIGFAHDADADRVAVVTNEGQPIGEDYSLVWGVAHTLKNHRRGPVVTNLSTSMAVEAVAREYGCEVHRAPVGDINVSGRMRQVDAVIGGEGNGGVIIPDIQHGRDGIAALAYILEFLALSGLSSAELSRTLPRFYISKGTVEFPRDRIPAMLAWLKSKEKNARIDEQDGLKLEWPKDGITDRWAHIRPSGTEPFVRVICEAPTLEEAQRMVKNLRDEVASLADAW